MVDSLDRIATSPTKVAQLTVPRFPELPLDIGRNPQSVLRFNEATNKWRNDLDRMLFQLPLHTEGT